MSKDKSDNQLKGTDYIPLTIGVKRSKLGLSYTDLQTYAIQGIGIDKEAELVDIATQHNMLTRNGSWYRELNPDTGEVGEAIGQSMDEARAWVVERKDEILEKLKNELD